ncbi:MAG: M4 family metallopeptidase, partial [Myxococcota bacterium]
MTHVLLLQLGLAAAQAALTSAAGPQAHVQWQRDATLRFLRPDNASPLTRSLSGKTPEAAARALFRSYSAAFGLRDADQEMVLERNSDDGVGGRLLRYSQKVRGVDVFGAGVRLRFDARGELRVVQSTLVGGIDVDPAPRLDAPAAAAIARGWHLGTLASTVATRETVSGPYGFRTHRARNIPGRDYLAYRVELRDARGFRAFVFVDAHAGKIVEVHPGVHSDLSRRVYDGERIPNDLAANLLWAEGWDLGTEPADAWADIGQVLNDTADAYNFFWRISGHTYDSYDNASRTMEIVYDPPAETYGCPNASWQGDAVYFCPGVTSDDIVAHEWTHAYTDYTDAMVYLWQPGALNEAYSDIFGETVDLINVRDTDTPAPPRGDELCSSLIGEGWPEIVIDTPARLAQVAGAGEADFGPAPVDVLPLSGTLVLVEDGTGDRADACEAITNGSAIADHIALIRRGTCNFTDKVLAVQAAGATAALIFNHEGDGLVTMSGDEPLVQIPALFMGQTLGDLLAVEPAASVSVTFRMSVPGGDTAEASYRWLIGEGATAFSRALRDMWSPTCLGDPGKVSDDEFGCWADDNGGVHTNSGVPNHAYALLVDGGAYNGETVVGLGLNKTAQIYWRAMTTYQEPFTQFPDHADALEAACADLADAATNVPDVATGLASGEVVAAADCVQVAAAMRAVQMRTFPSQCDYIPLLAKEPPALCEPTAEIFADDFEADLGWQVEHLGVAGSFVERDWVRTASVPGDHPGSAYYGATPDIGDCANDDQSGVLYLTSPTIAIAKDFAQPVLAFDHYIATEANYDGGNVQVSVNGGPWQLIGGQVFLYNAYNTDLVAGSGGNTDPLAGQSAFSGMDEGGFVGSWGQSQADL